MKSRITMLITTTLAMSSAYAVPNQTVNSANLQSLQQAEQQKNTVEKALGQNTTNQLKLSESPWLDWGLTQEEWSQYQQLKAGSRGIWTPNLDPLTMLGIEAKTEQERAHFAELLAKKEYQRVEKEIDFQIAYTRAFERLYPNQLPFSNDGNAGTPVSAVSRVIYFTKLDCDECNKNVGRLLNIVGDKPIDIYFLDSMKDDNKIRDWAVKYQIDIEKVRHRQITLNHDSGYWLKYGQGKMPVAFQISGDNQWKILRY